MFWKRFPNPMTLFVRSLYVFCHKKGVWAKNCSSHPFSMIRTVGNGFGHKGTTCLCPHHPKILAVPKAKHFLQEGFLIFRAPFSLYFVKKLDPFKGFLGSGPIPANSRTIRRKRFSISSMKLLRINFNFNITWARVNQN